VSAVVGLAYPSHGPHYRQFLFSRRRVPTCVITSKLVSCDVCFVDLSYSLSRFCPQILIFQRFCSCSHAKFMIPEDRDGRGISIFNGNSKPSKALGHIDRIRALYCPIPDGGRTLQLVPGE